MRLRIRPGHGVEATRLLEAVEKEGKARPRLIEDEANLKLRVA
tara:strand:+ start:334 stop:462 length:129 start_codon:yes stop_codon:yes gene_type:complete